MVVQDLKELKSLLLLCRKQGVTEITLGEVHIKLGDLPSEGTSSHVSSIEEVPSDNPYAAFPQGPLSPEQLMYYSSGGLPESDPFKQEN